MALIENNVTESKSSSGFEKKFEESAIAMMLDNMQIALYQKPFASMVRESTSNALDSIKEKNIAVKILNGQSKVEDHYVEKEGDIYKNSRFNSEYYDTKWLNPLDQVILTYTINKDALGRDLFQIEDTGVGLGGDRLAGFFSLGYSSKRLNSNELGGFGIGAKAPLSTGANSYRLISRYNGQEFKFDIFSQKVECVNTKWGANGETNDYIVFPETGFKAYYTKTTEKNGVIIEVEVKKHNKHQIDEAIKSQLMYFKEDIIYKEVGLYGTQSVEFKSPIIYENDDIIISDNRFYSRPHFVMKNVSYGLIDFRELELDQRHGNIGIKVSMEEVDVSPSRESVIYSQKTREAVTSKYNRIADTVTKLLNDSIVTSDYIEWINNCSNIMYNSSLETENKVLNRLANLIDKFQLKLNFITPDRIKIAYDSNVKVLLGKFLTAESVRSEHNYRTNKMSVKRNKVEISSALTTNVYLEFQGPKSKVTSYLANVKHPNGFVIIKPNFPTDTLDKLAEQYIHNQIEFNEFYNEGMIHLDNLALEAGKADPLSDGLNGEANKIRENIPPFKDTANRLKLFKESKMWQYYDESLVPEDYKEDASVEAIQELVEKEAKADYREIVKARKANGKFMVYTYSYRSSGKNVFEKHEVDTAKLTGKVIYGFDEDKLELIQLSKALGDLTGNSYSTYAFNNKYKVIKVSKANEKFVSDRIHVKDFLHQITDGVLTADDLFKDLFTANYVVKNLEEAEYLRNFKMFEPDLVRDFDILKTYTNRSNYSIDKLQGAKELLAAVDLQIERLNVDMDEETFIKKLETAVGHDLADQIIDIDLIDTSLYHKVKRVNEFTRVFGNFFNEIRAFTQRSSSISAELEQDIKIIIQAKRDQLEYDYPNLNY